MTRTNAKWLCAIGLAACLALWLVNSPLFWWLYDARSLYAPIFTRPIDPYTEGSSVEGDLYERFHTVHAVMLTFDASKASWDSLRAMTGRFHLEFSSGANVLRRFDIEMNRNLQTGITWDGAEVRLQRFDLPFAGADGPVHFKLTVVDPIAFPEGMRPPACCLVETAFNPK